jgi:hypothetical protein
MSGERRAGGAPDHATTAALIRIEGLLNRLAEQTKPPAPKITRSTLSPADKSKIIRKHGVAYYNRIPWS